MLPYCASRFPLDDLCWDTSRAASGGSLCQVTGVKQSAADVPSGSLSARTEMELLEQAVDDAVSALCLFTVLLRDVWQPGRTGEQTLYHVRRAAALSAGGIYSQTIVKAPLARHLSAPFGRQDAVAGQALALPPQLPLLCVRLRVRRLRQLRQAIPWRWR